MCTDCGCGERPADLHDHDHDHPHDHELPHDHDHDDDGPQHDSDGTLTIRRRILQHNDDLAAQLRVEFARQNVYVVNVVSSPGSGKTELLQRTMVELQPDVRVAAVTGDLATENDADRLGTAGAPVRQILTGTMCHLEADMVADAIADWDLAWDRRAVHRERREHGLPEWVRPG
jgi:hydrogenase nickel incorporation protein HypB